MWVLLLRFRALGFCYLNPEHGKGGGSGDLVGLRSRGGGSGDLHQVFHFKVNMDVLAHCCVSMFCEIVYEL